MYGMMHRGIRQMVIEAAGEEAWAAIDRKLGTGPAELISAAVYDDAMTIAMIEASAEVMGVEMGECLEAFGRYWVRFAERGSYGSIMQFTGSDLPTFIANLDRMHQAVVSALPEARVPSFSILERGEGVLYVGYSSERDGLESLVLGLLRGLLDRFNLTGMVEQVAARGHVPEFRITYAANPA